VPDIRANSVNTNVPTCALTRSNFRQSNQRMFRTDVCGHTWRCVSTRHTTDVEDRSAVLNDFHLFFETVECAHDIDVEQVGEVFGIGMCDGEDLALFLTFPVILVDEADDW
jgi:hypothetical protein